MGKLHDVAVLGAGVAGLTAGCRLKGLDPVVIEAADHIGRRTLSKHCDDGSWANYAAHYVTTANMDGAARSGEAAAIKALAAF